MISCVGITNTMQEFGSVSIWETVVEGSEAKGR